jgi:hypothetical protein
MEVAGATAVEVGTWPQPAIIVQTTAAAIKA